ncbi:glycogen/starch/alpha-glucan family phosphorylase [Thermoleptolyngbya sp. C42_A2020_037]|uniref:glycogen/starch/alpha-glucan family phosphorylase n=1 Tax=Thermoleptolyngbya sp. C42_A2020_037 TaxID=2747799 RepID=UPI0019F49F30|nr:glycogen/starch/alpha-glucan family phosphorylase [Thermoleptolyngbya sp. C42_A2020_037]MBF2086035.1 glycogen/starch/alpha-glucan family phosphorylase [Thermoleptolyngbya sp. C42_A2020_037]
MMRPQRFFPTVCLALCATAASALLFSPAAIAQTAPSQPGPMLAGVVLSQATPDTVADVLAEDLNVRIDGSPTMLPINQALKKYYEQEVAGSEVTIDASGTDAAIEKLLEGDIDLAAIARPLTRTEKLKGLKEIPISLEKIAIIVGKNNPFDGVLTVEQFAQIFRGEITDWSEVGGEPGPIRFIDRPLDSDTRLALGKYGILQNTEVALGDNVVRLDKDDTAEVIRLLGKDGISYAIASQLTNQTKARPVKIGVLQETLPEDTIYPYTVPRGYAYRDGSTAIASFLGLAQGERGQSAIAAAKLEEAKAIATGRVVKKVAEPVVETVAQAADDAVVAERRGLPGWLWLLLPLALLALAARWLGGWLAKRGPAVQDVQQSSMVSPPAPKAETQVEPVVTETVEPVVTETVAVEPVVAPQPVMEPVVPAEPVVAPRVVDVPTLFIQASKLVESGRYAEALPYLDEVVEAESNDPQIWLNRGLALAGLGRREPAIESFDRAIALQPDLTEAWISKGETLVLMGREDDARAAFNKVVELRPTFVRPGYTPVPIVTPEPEVIAPAPTESPAVTEPEIVELISTEEVIELTQQPAPEAPVADSFEALKESVEEAVAPIVESVAEPVAETVEEVIDTVTETVIEPVAEPIMESVMESVAEPVTETIESAIALPTEPVAEPVAEPVPETPVEPAGGTLKQAFLDALMHYCGKTLDTAEPWDKYMALSYVVRDRLLALRTPETDWATLGDRLVIELSAEYLPGPHLANNLLAMGLSPEAQTSLAELGITLEDLIALEEEPGLGRGGLGRLMICYLESLATATIPAIGYGIRYEFGIFDQDFSDGWQVEVVDEWLKNGNPWEIERPEAAVNVLFGGRSEAYMDADGRYRMRWVPDEAIRAIPYDTLIPGYRSGAASLLRLWKAETDENLSKVLYPSDMEEYGKEVRLRQQFFFVSASLQDAIRRHLEAGGRIDTLPERITIQINDTDPIIAIPELMRLLMDGHGLEWDQAWDITCKTFAYTNHSLLPEALDSNHYSLPTVQKLFPRHFEILLDLNSRFLGTVREQYPGDEGKVIRLSLVDEAGEKHFRLVNLALLSSYAVNGVSAQHTELLKQRFADFVELMPQKFSNQTNGVSPRRFLALSNPPLADLITQKLSSGWVTHLETLKDLEAYAEDAEFRAQWRQAKLAAKQSLAALIQHQWGLSVNPMSLFDLQANEIHEHKRQHLNLLHVVTLYNRIKANPGAAFTPRAVLFAGKAAPDYATAKLMIKLINAVAETVNADGEVGDRLKVVFIKDFTIKNSQVIFPAADVAEYIATAGTEASATGNLIAALNGGLLLGTLDGSNLELADAVGAENSFLFGRTAAESLPLYEGDHNRYHLYESLPELKQAIDQIASGAFSYGDGGLFRPLLDRLLYGDPYGVLADYAAYVAAQDRVATAYGDVEGWTRKSILTAARAGYFSSDRAIYGYSQSIWKIATSPLQSSISIPG